jgi:hypothetical protein
MIMDVRKILFLLSLLYQWQTDGELASFSQPVTARLDAPAVKLNEASRQRKSNTQSAGDGFERRLSLIKQVE